MAIYVVTLHKESPNTFSLNFYCSSNGYNKTKNIKINEMHKGAPIGKMCEELYNLNHTKWFIEREETLLLYEYSQPDLMLSSELNKAKKNNI